MATTEERLDNLERLINRLGERVRSVLDNVDFPTGRLSFYKSLGAAQFTFLPPKPDAAGRHIDKEGAILLEVAPGTGKQVWDWSQKVNFALSVNDIMNIAQNPYDVDIFHQHQSNPKKLKVQPGQRSGYMLSVAAGKGAERTQVTVPLSEAEWNGICRILMSQLPKLIAWK